MDLPNSFLLSSDLVKTELPESKLGENMTDHLMPVKADLAGGDRSIFMNEQQYDPTLATCLTTVANPETQTPSIYSVVDGILIRNNLPLSVIVCVLVSQVLSLSGHSGIRKTYQHILPYSFWPGISARDEE